MDRSAWQALFNMGEMLRVGEGVEQDKAKAFQLFSASGREVGSYNVGVPNYYHENR